MFLEASFRADIDLLDECLQIQKSAKMCIKVIVFCVTPIVPESFMIVSSTNVLVCPGETVPNGRRFWRALIYDPCLSDCHQGSIQYRHLTSPSISHQL